MSLTTGMPVIGVANTHEQRINLVGVDDGWPAGAQPSPEPPGGEEYSPWRALLAEA